MGRKRKQLTALAASAIVAIGLAGCGGGDGGNQTGDTQKRTEATKGGTLHFLQASAAEHLDPQRVYIGRDLSNLNRLAYRSWVAFPPGATDAEEGSTPVADVATDTGTANADATQWSFTVKPGVKWQDGSPVTCEDFAYGASRTFAQDIITGGPNYIIGYLDVPKDKDGSPAYKGPYTKVGQDLYDKAVSCKGDTITYKFNKPWPDFPLAVASLRAFDPYKQSEDEGEKSNLKVFSNGPYMLDGKWNFDTGGKFVRNPEWDKSTDDIRQANPDEVVFELGLEPETLIDRLIADSGDDADAVATTSVTAAQYSQITGPVADRSVNIESPFVDYVLPNFNQMKNVKVRQALAAATDRQAYSNALGGDKASTPALTIVNPAVPGFQENDAFGAAEGGDIEKAKQLLQESGEKLPYPITFTYPIGSEATDKAMAALKEGWDAAGFKTTLDGLDPSGPYYETVQNPGSDSDVIWGGWGADWPSVSTVIPPLFDSRINLTPASNGQDYGNYKSDEVNSMIDDALAEPDLDAAATKYQDIDKKLAEDVAYVPLDITKFYYLRGSKVENYVNSTSTSGYPDLAVISLSQS
jgi:peptide/nickel transport system substrate-binding protein